MSPTDNPTAIVHSGSLPQEWRNVIKDQLASNYPLLQSVPELKVVFTQDVGRNFKTLQSPGLASTPSVEPAELDVQPTEEDLLELLRGGRLRPAFACTTRLLLQSEGDPTRPMLHIWQTRLNLYIRFGAFNEAKLELDQFSQLEDLPIQFGQNSAGHGGVPFTLLLSVAHLQLLCGARESAQGKLSKLLQQCRENSKFYLESTEKLPKHHSDAFVQLWKERECKVISMLANYGTEMADFKFAINVLSDLRAMQSDPVEIASVESQLGKLFLHFGDIDAAERHFQEAARFCKEESVDDRLRVIFNSALLAIANGDYQSAYSAYERGWQLKPDDSTCVNNMAVCALYLGKSADGIRLFEEAFEANPSAMVTESCVANVLALYRLRSATGADASKAFVKQIVAKHAHQTFDCRVFEAEL